MAVKSRFLMLGIFFMASRVHLAPKPKVYLIATGEYN